MNKYILIEPISSLESKHVFNIDDGKFHLLNVLRMITGSACVKDQINQKIIKLNNNLTYIPITKVKYLSLKKVLDNFPDISSTAFKDFNFTIKFLIAKNRNREFYKIIEKELLEAIIAYQNNNFVQLFLFIYRIIETISFTTPLIYLSKNVDYFKTYDELKKLFNAEDNNLGELGFLKRFISTLFKEEDYLKVGAKIDFSCIGDDVNRSSCMTIYKQYMTKEKGNSKKVLGLKSEDSLQITLEVINFHEFFITLRNRFFHNLKGTIRDNIQMVEIFDLNKFFQPIAIQGLNHIGLILFKLIEKDLEI